MLGCGRVQQGSPTLRRRNTAIAMSGYLELDVLVIFFVWPALIASAAIAWPKPFH